MKLSSILWGIAIVLLGVNIAFAQDASNDLFRAALKFYFAKDYKSAHDLFQKGLYIGKNDEANGKALYYYGDCLLKLDRPRQALIAFRRSAQLSPDSEQGKDALAEERRLEAALPVVQGTRQEVVENAANANAVKAFKWMYRAQPSPGLRTWRTDDRGRWHEHYPDGHEAKIFDVLRRGAVATCPGAIASSSVDRGFEVFIPDVGCPRMSALFRRDGGTWSVMGEMTDIR